MRLALLGTTTLLLGLARAKEFRVTAGQSIQSAINLAPPGSRIVVDAGTYAERLSISKNRIELVGKPGAVLAPGSPGDSPPNDCTNLAFTDTAAAICIVGTGLVTAEPGDDLHRTFVSVTGYVEGVLVQGFTVNETWGVGIAVIGAKNTEIRKNTIGATYFGILTLGSMGSLVTYNTVAASPALTANLAYTGIKIFETDSGRGTHATQNTISGCILGLSVRTSHADVGHNKLAGCCFGVNILKTDGVSVTHNHVGATSRLCGPDLFGFAGGILVAGARNSEVRHNDVSDQNDYGDDPSHVAAGVSVYDVDNGDGSPVAVASGNQVTHNTLLRNEKDIDVAATGANEIAHNTCDDNSVGCKS